ncbi:unannotated protein [freshwater metagenome]|uniref:Unannotated protein n=1 Tax=freshwater metagenome TaxID=449393 RepID=A0A6J6VF65_9ZZZZ
MARTICGVAMFEVNAVTATGGWPGSFALIINLFLCVLIRLNHLLCQGRVPKHHRR